MTARALVAAAAVLLGAALLFGGGSGDGRVAWIGGAALVVAGLLCGAALWGKLPLPAIGREGVAFALLAAGFLVWTGVTILWSILPDRSWDYFNRGLSYLVFAVLGAFVGSLLAPRFVAWTLGGLVALTCVWALAGKVVPALYGDYGRLARLRSPVGYWNALALVAVFGIPIALWAATRGRRPVRAGAVVGLYVLLLALLLTYSRGGILSALVALAIWFALTRDRFDGVLAFVAAGAPAALVFGVALLLPGITEDAQPHSVRVHDGLVFAPAVLLGGGAAFALAYFVRYRPGPERERLLLRVALGVAIACVAVGGAVVAASGNPFGAQTEVAQGPSRLAEGSLNNRWEWWKEAWHGWVDEPLGGTGAGSFELVHRKFRDSSVDVREPHDLPLQFASETGLVGLLLWGGAIAAALLGALACSGTAARRRAGSGACVGHRPARVPRPRAARLRLGLRRAVRGRLLRDRLPARDRSRADSHGPRVRVGRGRRARDVGGALLDRGAADRRPPGQRGLLADRERLLRRGRDREERALAEPARDRARSWPGLRRRRRPDGSSPRAGSMFARSTSSL